MSGEGGGVGGGHRQERVRLSRRELLQTTAAAGAVSALTVAGIGTTTALEPGEERWRFETGATVYPSPTVVDGTVYVGSTDETLYALSADDGARQWSFEADGRFNYGSPHVVDGTVYVGSADNNVYAIDATDGTEVWSFETDGPVDQSAPTVVDGTLYIGSGDNNLYALSATDGTQQWSFETAGSVRPSPTVVQGVVYVGSRDHSIYALDADDGTEQWSFETGDRVSYSSPTVVDGVLYIGSDDGNIYALSAADGSEVWRFETGERIVSSPTVASGTVYVGSDDHNVYALDTDTGAVEWAFDAEGQVYSSPTVVEDTVYVGSSYPDGERVYALDAADGSKRWEFSAGGTTVSSSPTVVDGVLYVGSRDNFVYAVETEHDGSSEGSRVLLGTGGHHHGWTGNSADVNLADFSVEITGTNGPVVEGETLEVTVEVENTGHESDRQTLSLEIDGQEVDSVEETLDSGETTTVTLGWNTAAGDAGSYDASVESEDDSDQAGVTVIESAHFSVDITDTDEPVVQGETLEVTADIENTGDETATQTVTLEIDGQEEDAVEQSLDGGETNTVMLTWDTGEEDADSYQVVVASEDTSDETSVTIHDVAGFLIAITETNAPVEAGDILDVTVDVENTGDETDTQDVILEINGQRVETDTVTLHSGESRELTLGWEATNHNGVGLRVASEDDVDNRYVSLTPDSDGADEAVIEIVDANTPVSEGDILEVDVEITSTADDELTQDVEFDVDGKREETRAVTLGSGETTIETFTWEVDGRTSVGLRAAGTDDWDNTFLLLADTDFTPAGL